MPQEVGSTQISPYSLCFIQCLTVCHVSLTQNPTSLPLGPESSLFEALSFTTSRACMIPAWAFCAAAASTSASTGGYAQVLERDPEGCL
jgi:hypothetical protein